MRGEILIVKDRKTVLYQAVGWKDRARDIAWELNTICRIRSMTKPFVGTAVLMMMEEGKLSLGDPVSQCVSAFDNPRSRGVAIRQLHTHSGGFTESSWPDDARVHSLGDVANAVGVAGPAHKPGTKYDYATVHTAVLGHIVALVLVSGVPLEEFIRERIVEPPVDPR